jgi:hypothetical protein
VTSWRLRSQLPSSLLPSSHRYLTLPPQNVLLETLFGSSKVERRHGRRFETMREAKDETIAWLLRYNKTRMPLPLKRWTACATSVPRPPTPLQQLQTREPMQGNRADPPQVSPSPLGLERVMGSIPIRSTNQIKPLETRPAQFHVGSQKSQKQPSGQPFGENNNGSQTAHLTLHLLALAGAGDPLAVTVDRPNQPHFVSGWADSCLDSSVAPCPDDRAGALPAQH